MRHVVLLCFSMMVFTVFPALAQDAGDPTYGQRVELAKKMHQIWPVRTKVENALSAIAETMQPQERAPFKAAMRKAIKFKQLEEESIEAMVDTFTVEELEAMVQFYGSKEGRSVSAKIEDYQAQLEPVMTRMLDKALMDIRIGTTPGRYQ